MQGGVRGSAGHSLEGKATLDGRVLRATRRPPIIGLVSLLLQIPGHGDPKILLLIFSMKTHSEKSWKSSRISSKKLQQQRQTLEIVEDLACEDNTFQNFRDFAFVFFFMFVPGQQLPSQDTWDRWSGECPPSIPKLLKGGGGGWVGRNFLRVWGGVPREGLQGLFPVGQGSTALRGPDLDGCGQQHPCHG